MSDTLVAPAIDVVKPAKTDFIAIHGAGWGLGIDETAAIYRSLSEVGSTLIGNLARNKKPLEVRVYEVSEDWQVTGWGSITATYLKQVAKAEYSAAALEKVMDVMENIQNGIDYED